MRVAHNDDDAVIAALIAGARSHVEAQTRRALITQTWRLVRDAWPADGRIAVVPVPLIEIVAARVFDEDGTPQAIDLDAFVADTAAAPAIIAFASWSLPAPAPGRKVGGIEIDVDVGYGDEAGRRAGAAAAGDPAARRALVREPRPDRGRAVGGGAAGDGRGADRAVSGAVAMTGPGELRHRLVLEAPVETPDGAGGVTRSYATLATRVGEGDAGRPRAATSMPMTSPPP